MHMQAEKEGVPARVCTLSAPVREREKEKDREREREEEGGERG